jgi:hypothetical protein
VRGFAHAAVTDQWEQTVESGRRLLLQDSNTVPLVRPKAGKRPKPIDRRQTGPQSYKV